jgi:hypothetical protein
MDDMMHPTAYFRVLAPMVAPIAARPGEYVALWLHHPDYTLSVIDRHRRQTPRTANPPHGVVSGALLHLCLDGVLTGLTPADAAVLQACQPAA